MKYYRLLSIVWMALAVLGCKEKASQDVIIAKKVVVVKNSAPVRMQDYSQETTFQWLGKDYVCSIRRTADDSLAVVKDENGQAYIDNRIFLTIKRNDGSVFFQRSFTKSSFDSCLNGDYRATGVLEGLVFDRVEGDCVLFAASVCHPQTDEYIPIVMTVSRMGSISLARDSQMDISTQSQEEDV